LTTVETPIHPALAALREAKRILGQAAHLASQGEDSPLLSDDEAIELVHMLGEIVSTIREDFACGEFAIDTEAELANSDD